MAFRLSVGYVLFISSKLIGIVYEMSEDRVNTFSFSPCFLKTIRDFLRRFFLKTYLLQSFEKKTNEQKIAIIIINQEIYMNIFSFYWRAHGFPKGYNIFSRLECCRLSFRS